MPDRIQISQEFAEALIAALDVLQHADGLSDEDRAEVSDAYDQLTALVNERHVDPEEGL